MPEAVDDGDLVRDLGAAKHRDQRPRRVLEHLRELNHLALEQQSGGPFGDQMGDTLGRGVGAVCRAERVVYVHVGERRQRGRQLGIVLRLSGLVAHVLEHEHVPGPQAVDERPHLLSDHRRRECDIGADQRREAVGDRPQRQLRLAILRSAEMRNENQHRSLPP